MTKPKTQPADGTRASAKGSISVATKVKDTMPAPASAGRSAKSVSPASSVPSAVDSGDAAPAPVKTAAAKAAASKTTPVKQAPSKEAPSKEAPAKVIKAGIAPKTLEKLRKRLEDVHAQELKQAADLMAEAESLAVDREQGDTQFDEESGEGDTLSVERERDLALSAASRQLVEEVERALRRLDAGTFGICARCSKRIALPRLEFIPHAAHCIECANRLTRRR